MRGSFFFACLPAPNIRDVATTVLIECIKVVAAVAPARQQYLVAAGFAG